MTLLDQIKLIDFYLHGVDRGVKIDSRIKTGFIKVVFVYPDKFGYWNELEYHTSLDALRPVIVKLNQSDLRTELSKLNLTMAIYQYIYEGKNFEPVFHAVIDCIKYLNEKEK